MEIFGINIDKYCKRCDELSDHYVDLIKKSSGTFRLLQLCNHCGEIIGTEFTAENLVELLFSDDPALAQKVREIIMKRF